MKNAAFSKTLRSKGAQAEQSMRGVLLAVLGALAVGSSGSAAQEPNGGGTIVVDTARVFDGRRVIERARLIVRDGRVVAVGPRGSLRAAAGAQIVDLSARTVIPGLIAGHSHVGAVSGVNSGSWNFTRANVAKDLLQFQSFGIVAVASLGMNGRLFYDLRREPPTPNHADLYGAGGGIGMEGGAPRASINPGDGLERVGTPEAARAAVDRTARSGVDLIKLWVDDMGGTLPKMPEPVYAAAIAQAHAKGLKVAVHIHDLADAKAVVRAGADILAHGIRDLPVDQEMIDLLRSHDVWYVPTVNVDESEYIYAEHPEWLTQPFFGRALNSELRAQLADPSWRAKALANAFASRRAVATNLANLKRLRTTGVRIAFGTDSGARPLRIPGFAEHLELGHLVSAGFTPLEALHIATAATAEMLSLPDRGCLWAGCRADFLVLRANPMTSIAATGSIESVWRNGNKVLSLHPR